MSSRHICLPRLGKMTHYFILTLPPPKMNGMIAISSVVLLLAYCSTVLAFAPPVTINPRITSSTSIYQYAGTQQYVDVTDVRSPRDVYSM